MDDRSTNFGTLAWIGSTTDQHCVEAFEYCVKRFPQVAMRENADHLLALPAQHVTHLIMWRPDRSRADSSAIQVLQHYKTAKLLLLLGSGCEGESRSGEPWPFFEHCYWHRWNQVITAWFEMRIEDAQRSTYLILTRDRPGVDALCESLSMGGSSVLVADHVSPASMRNIHVCFWDDTLATAANEREWLRRTTSVNRVSTFTVKHIWLAGFPRVDEWAAAKQGGVHALFSKPSTISIHQCLQGLIA